MHKKNFCLLVIFCAKDFFGILDRAYTCFQNAAGISYNIVLHSFINEYCQAKHRHHSSTMASTKIILLIVFSFFGIEKKIF